MTNKPVEDIEPSTNIEKIFERSFNNKTFIKIFIIAVIAISMSLFHMYTSAFGTLEAWQQRSITLSFILLLMPFLYPFKTKIKLLRFFMDGLFLLLAIASIIYTLDVYPDILFRKTSPSQADLIFGGIMIALVLEGTRRAVGYFLSIIILLSVLYAYFGNLFPGMLSHPGFRVERIIATFYNSTSGLFGLILGAMSNYIIIFIIFGAFLLKSSAGRMFIDLAYGLTGSKSGGPAKVAVLASGLMGMVQGAAVSNVATTGSLTIPLMKRVGYRPHFAGGVEAAASAGGQLMPPIMGASAFIIATNLQLPYVHIALYALAPALLYYTAIYFMVHFEAKKRNLAGLAKSELPNPITILKEGWFLFIPIILVILLLVMGYSVQLAGFYSILGIIIVSAFKKSTRMGLKDILAALELGAKNSVSIGVICAAAGLLIGSVTLTGLGLKFSSIILGVTNQSLLMTLIMVMLASIILGMGMPTVSAYVILAVLAVPALIDLNVNPIAAHFFVLYFSIMSNVTPPVAVAAYTAGAIANADPNKTGFAALKIVLGTFLIPYMFVFGPSLILQGPVDGIIISVLTAFIGIYAFTSSLQGWMIIRMNMYERILGFVSSILLLYPNTLLSMIGVLALSLLITFHYFRKVRVSKLDIQEI